MLVLKMDDLILAKEGITYVCLDVTFINFRCTVLTKRVDMICTSKESLVCCTLRTVCISP